MKEIIHNDDNLDEKEVNKEVKRSKIIILNSHDEILLATTNNNYYLVGGHVDDDETFDECVVREVREETGIEIPLESRSPYLVIKYLCKDYPNVGDNTKYVANYYVINSDLKPDLSKVELTEGEKDGNFELKFIHKDKIIDELINSLETCTKKNVVRDTIDAVEIFLESLN